MKYFLVIFLIMFQLLTGAETVAQDGLALLSINYESGSLSSSIFAFDSERKLADDSLIIDCTVARSGQCSHRTKLLRSKDYISFGNYRAESSTIKISSTRYSRGDMIRYGFSMMLASDWVRSKESKTVW